MRGRQTVRVGPNVGLMLVTFGPVFCVEHHHPPGQSLSAAQPNCVQNALASVGLIP
jgi:hypothetical protein